MGKDADARKILIIEDDRNINNYCSDKISFHRNRIKNLFKKNKCDIILLKNILIKINLIYGVLGL